MTFKMKVEVLKKKILPKLGVPRKMDLVSITEESKDHYTEESQDYQEKIATKELYQDSIDPGAKFRGVVFGPQGLSIL